MPAPGAEQVEVVIVGGGVIGCSIAYHLALFDVAPVVLLERNALASGATSRAAALLTQVRPKAHQVPLVLGTYAAIAALRDEIDDPPALRHTGSLQLAASPQTHTDLLQLGGIAESHDIPFVWLDRSEAARRVPWLDGEAALGIAFTPEDGVIDPYLLTHGYARAARSRGVAIRTGAAVKGLIFDGNAVRGVRTTAGEIRARWVVDATGAWAGLLARDAGVRLPMAPVRSHYWITAADSGFPSDMPYVILPDAGAYVRPELGGLIVGLREAHSLSVDARTLPSNIASVSFGDEMEGWRILMEGRPRLCRFYPGLDEARFTTFVTGLSTYTPDGEFVLGPVPGLKGYLAVTGCCGAGIAASGGIGLALAELAADRPSSFNLAPFRADRFGAVDVDSEGFRARCAAARSTKVSG